MNDLLQEFDRHIRSLLEFRRLMIGIIYNQISICGDDTEAHRLSMEGEMADAVCDYFLCDYE